MFSWRTARSPGVAARSRTPEVAQRRPPTDLNPELYTHRRAEAGHPRLDTSTESAIGLRLAARIPHRLRPVQLG